MLGKTVKHSNTAVSLSYKQQQKMNRAIYTNKATNETHTIANVRDLAQAWSLAGLVCRRKGWNFQMFAFDVLVTVQPMKLVPVTDDRNIVEVDGNVTIVRRNKYESCNK